MVQLWYANPIILMVCLWLVQLKHFKGLLELVTCNNTKMHNLGHFNLVSVALGIYFPTFSYSVVN